MEQTHMEAAGRLVGNVVENLSGDRLGVVREFVLDLDAGCIAYAILSRGGGFLGKGEKYHPVPWRALEIDPESERFVLDLDREAMANAPGFSKDDWPDLASGDWAREVDAFYRVTPLEATGRSE